MNINKDYAIIGGAMGHLEGVAYIFEMDIVGKWNEVKILKSSVEKDLFGMRSVKISDRYAVVGAPWAEGGSAYVFERNNQGKWNDGSMIVADGLTVGDLFGNAVAISGETIFVGAPSAGQSDQGRGEIYQFELVGNSLIENTWKETRKIITFDKGDYFGSELDVSDGFLIAGAPNNDANNSAGSVYLYKIEINSQVNFGNNPVEETLVITPNADGHYDSFTIPFDDNQLVKIYNRGGQLVNEFTTPAEWDATDGYGKRVAMGVYVLVSGRESVQVTVVR